MGKAIAVFLGDGNNASAPSRCDFFMARRALGRLCARWRYRDPGQALAICSQAQLIQASVTGSQLQSSLNTQGFAFQAGLVANPAARQPRQRGQRFYASN